MVEFAKKVERIGKRVLIKNNYPGTILRKYFLGVVTLITRESHAPGGPVGRPVHRGPLCAALGAVGCASCATMCFRRSLL